MPTKRRLGLESCYLISAFGENVWYDFEQDLNASVVRCAKTI